MSRRRFATTFFSAAHRATASRRYDHLVHSSTRRCSRSHVRRAIQTLRDGSNGNVCMARPVHDRKCDSLGFEHPENLPPTVNRDLWVGPVPIEPYNRLFHPYNWHMFLDFGEGDPGNNAILYSSMAGRGLHRGLPAKIYSASRRSGYQDPGQTSNTRLMTYPFGDGAKPTEVRNRDSNREGHAGSSVHAQRLQGVNDLRSGLEGCKVFPGGRALRNATSGSLTTQTAQVVRRSAISRLRSFQRRQAGHAHAGDQRSVTLDGVLPAGEQLVQVETEAALRSCVWTIHRRP
jgi:hypothetical protein